MYYITFWLHVAVILAGVFLLILTKRHLDAKTAETADTKGTNKGIIILVVSVVLAFSVLSFGDATETLTRIAFLLLIVPALAIIIDYWFSGLRWVNKVAEQRIKQYTVREEEITAKIQLLNERARRIENKAEKVEWMLKKVSD